MTVERELDIPLINGWALGHQDAVFKGETVPFPFLYRDGVVWQRITSEEADLLRALVGRVQDLQHAVDAAAINIAELQQMLKQLPVHWGTATEGGLV